MNLSSNGDTNAEAKTEFESAEFLAEEGIPKNMRNGTADSKVISVSIKGHGNESSDSDRDDSPATDSSDGEPRSEDPRRTSGAQSQHR